MPHSMPHSTKKTQGFTLVEILLVVFLIAVLATAAISSYVNSTDTFKFLGAYQQLTSALNTARSNAINNKRQNNVTPKKYGVCITATSVITFADSGDVEGKLDLKTANKTQAGDCYNNNIFFEDTASGANEDTVLADKSWKFSGYSLAVNDAKGAAITLPVLVFYEGGMGNLMIVDGNNIVISKDASKFVNVRFSNIKTTRYAKIHQVSGLVEESVSP